MTSYREPSPPPPLKKTWRCRLGMHDVVIIEEGTVGAAAHRLDIADCARCGMRGFITSTGGVWVDK